MKHFKILFIPGIFLSILMTYLFARAPDTLWTKVYGGNLNDSGLEVIQLQDSSYVIGGYGCFLDSLPDFWLVKTNPSGDTIWTRTYGGDNSDICRSVDQTYDGGFILARE